ncbi:MAG: hypothetical protein ACEPOZ_03480 [Marinifilaceae bacterium]
MNPKTLVRISNIIGIISIVLLIYWVFVFMTVEVFGLKVFRENITQTFYMSILGILALMFGALIINIMFNLTRIAQKHNNDKDLWVKGKSKLSIALFLLSFPIIFGLLFGGDYLTSRKKEKLLIQSAKSIVQDNSHKADALVDYRFNEKWILKTADILEILSKTDKHFPNISVIVKDSIDGSGLFLSFNNYYNNLNDTIKPKKKEFIYESTKPERDYLNKVFNTNYKELRFSASNGDYELFYPYYSNNKKIVLYFSDYQRYGKIGS